MCASACDNHVSRSRSCHCKRCKLTHSRLLANHSLHHAAVIEEIHVITARDRDTSLLLEKISNVLNGFDFDVKQKPTLPGLKLVAVVYSIFDIVLSIFCNNV